MRLTWEMFVIRAWSCYIFLAILDEWNGSDRRGMERKGSHWYWLGKYLTFRWEGCRDPGAAGSSHHDRLKGKSQKQYWFESNSWFQFRIHSIEEKKEALRTDSQSRQGEKMWQPEGILFAFSNNEFESKPNIIDIYHTRCKVWTGSRESSEWP